MSPFQALYGREPPSLFDTYARPSHNVAVADLLAEREDTLRTLKLRIQKAQDAMAEFANRKRKDIEFKVGDSVFLKLQPYRQTSVGKPLSNKLARRYYGPYEILERVGKVAYRLQLPADSKIHNIFHVSLLKAFVPSATVGVELPDVFNGSRPFDTLIEATACRTVLVNKIPQTQWLVKWASDSSVEPSWESETLLRAHFPDLRLVDKAIAKGGGVDTTLANDVTDADETGLHEPMQLGKAADGRKEPETEPTGWAETRETKRDRPKRSVSRPAKYRDFVSR